MSLDKYVLNGNGDAVVEPDRFRWAEWLEGADRKIGNDYIGEVHVSTVFLGIDHAFGEGPPVLWETMIFGGPHNDYQERYTSREDAIAGHAKALRIVRGEEEP